MLYLSRRVLNYFFPKDGENFTVTVWEFFFQNYMFTLERKSIFTSLRILDIFSRIFCIQGRKFSGTFPIRSREEKFLWIFLSRSNKDNFLEYSLPDSGKNIFWENLLLDLTENFVLKKENSYHTYTINFT